MIKKIFIENLILIQKCEITFGPHLNILTGETGSGKSVLLTALRLIAGDRADLDLIGKWGEQTIIEAQINGHCIRREIHRNGKNPCFIDSHLTTLSFLKQFIGTKIEIVDQNSSHTLSSSDQQRKKFDLYAQASLEVAQFADSFQEEERLRDKFRELQEQKNNREQELDWAETSLSLIREIDWKEGEEECLNAEHEKLVHIQELTSSVEQIASQIAENPFLKQIAHQLQQTVRFDPKLQPTASSLKNCSLELEEIEHHLRSYIDRLEADPAKLATIEARLAAIESLKKRFGPTQADVEKKRLMFQNLLFSQSEISDKIVSLRTQLEELKEKNFLLAKIISDKRAKAKASFSKSVLDELRTLNLPHAQFQVTLEKKNLTATGNEAIQFLFSANPGHPPLPLEECASGGEQSRLLLAIQSTLAEKDNTECLIFDEIDSNIGGYTASIVGEKLQKLASHRQVICVTHFVQVARFAMNHFLVCKRNASTEIIHLTQEKREMEYNRMQGKLK